MNVQPPLVREELCRDTELASAVNKKLQDCGFAAVGVDTMKDALVHVFARYCEILSERLNRVPQSYHSAFVRMLGASTAPAIPARVPLSFTPVKSTQNYAAIVPRSTQVSAPSEDESQPLVIFETTKDLPLVQAELKHALAVDTSRLMRCDVSSILSVSGTAAIALSPETTHLNSSAPLERVFYIGQPAIIGADKLTRLRVAIELDQRAGLPLGWKIEWGIPSGNAFTPLIPESDSTACLTQNGELVFTPPENWPSRTINSETMPWLGCRLYRLDDLQQISPLRIPPDQNKKYLALINGIQISGYRSLNAVPPAGAFNNGIPLDVSKDFYPLGERPRFGDVFYVLSELFAAPGTKVVLDIKLTNPSGAVGSPIPPVSKRGNPMLRWEGHTSRGWVPLNFTDSTHSLTEDGIIEFQMPADAKPVMINGNSGGWIRARLVGGNYVSEETASAHTSLQPANPPAISEMHVTSIQEFGPMPPERLIVESDLVYSSINPAIPFHPFPVSAEKELMLYLALFSLRGACTLNGQTLNLYSFPYERGRHVLRNEDIFSKAPATSSWQALTTDGWRDCAVNDSTRRFRTPGIIEVQMPGNISKWHGSVLDPDRQFFWLRIVWRPSNPGKLPSSLNLIPQRLLLNTVFALQTLKLADELLGSSNGRPRQVFHTLHKPIIGSVTLQVHELDKTDQQAGQGLETARPDFGSINIPRTQVNREWISWSAVEDFSNSDSHSRHYILDRVIGSVRFGDGINGRIPPSGANNIRMHEYHTGGGEHGNLSTGTVTQLHTTIPYVESVINHEPAAGGQDQENFDSLNRGTTAFLRHRDRAVSIDDYADLASKASPEVARAKCMPVCDMQGILDPEAKLGSVCVIVVPKRSEVRSDLHDETRPQPSFDLLKNVSEFLNRRRPIGINLTVLGPEYVSVGITAEFAWAPDCATPNRVAEIEGRINRFLHPITGGPDGLGWEFGQRPHASDFYPLLGTIEGLDYIRALELHFDEERPGLLASGAFLICPGKHEIRLC